MVIHNDKEGLDFNGIHNVPPYVLPEFWIMVDSYEVPSGYGGASRAGSNRQDRVKAFETLLGIATTHRLEINTSYPRFNPAEFAQLDRLDQEEE